MTAPYPIITLLYPKIPALIQETISMPVTVYSTASLCHFFTPTLALPLKGEGIFEIVSKA